MNQRDGTFVEAALERGVAYSEDGQPKAGMGIAAGDYDNDGDEDLLVLNLRREGASLFQNDGRGYFTDVSRASRIHSLTLPYTGFGTGWFDFDNDGCLDLFMANGAVTLGEARGGQGSPYAEKSLLLRGACEGRSFENLTPAAGAVMNEAEVHRAAAFGDLDNDGRIDIVVTVNNGPVRLLHNESAAGNWVSVALQPPGGRVGLFLAGAHPPVWRTSRADGSYMSAGDSRVHLGLGASAKIDQIVVEWPDGSNQAAAASVNSRIVVNRR
jgi:hypothetical protein